MMKKTSTYILIAVSILLIDFLFFELSEHWIIFDVFIRLFLWFSSFVFIIIGLIVLLLNKQFWLYNLIALFLGILIIIMLYSAKKYFSNKDIVLSAYYDGDINGINIELRSNNRYKINNSSLMGGNILTGNYLIKKDTIIFDSKYPLGKDSPFFTNKLLIKDSTLIIIYPDSGYTPNLEFRITSNKIDD